MANFFDLKLPYALDSEDKLISINDVTVSGLACNCRCPKCRERLEARIGTGKREKHFAHSKHSNCHGAYMTILHMRSEEIIEKQKAVMAPKYTSKYGALLPRMLEFVDVEVERREDRKDLQPDIVGITEDGKRWAIEICNTHEVNDKKRQKLFESGITCLEIDVSNQTVENLEDFLLHSNLCREWINNPNDEETFPKPTPEQIAMEEEEAQSRLDYYLNQKDGRYKLYLTTQCKGCPAPPRLGRCIYAKEVIKTKDAVFTVCDDLKRRKDLEYIPANRGRVRMEVMINDSSIKIPDECRCLNDYYIYIKSKHYFSFCGQKHLIRAVEYCSECGQLLIFHAFWSGISYHYVTCVYIDYDDSVKAMTIECSRNDWPNILFAKQNEWNKMIEDAKEIDNLPFSKTFDDVPF